MKEYETIMLRWKLADDGSWNATAPNGDLCRVVKKNGVWSGRVGTVNIGVCMMKPQPAMRHCSLIVVREMTHAADTHTDTATFLDDFAAEANCATLYKCGLGL